MQGNLYVGTSGMSVWFSRDLGETWKRPYTESGLYLEARVWSLAPSGPGRVLAGTDRGLHEWDAAAESWTHLPSPMDGLEIWSLRRSPHEPEGLIAGTRPAALFHSFDAGRSWEKAAAELALDCIFVGTPRVTSVAYDPQDRCRVWCGIEIDGVHMSEDGGRSWRKCAGKGLVSEDVHDVAAVYRGDECRLFATTNKGLHVSRDGGATFRFIELGSPWQYTRAVVPAADGTVFVTNGDGPPGSTGKLWRSRDGGTSFEEVPLPVVPNSTIWTVAASPHEPRLLFACSNLGELYRSRDGGGTWEKLARELGEIRALLLTP